MCNFLQVQGNQRIARKRMRVSRTSDFADLSAFGVIERRNCGKGPFMEGNYLARINPCLVANRPSCGSFEIKKPVQVFFFNAMASINQPISRFGGKWAGKACRN
jgi:hypothetical protein